MILLKNIEIYSPKYLGKKDILFNNKIISIDENININFKGLKTIDCKNMKLLPGIIDQHVHIVGGGGEGGFESRSNPIDYKKIIEAGISSIVGTLGTDGYTRNIDFLIAKTKELKTQGINAYCYTGSYDFPTKTFTGDVKKDIIFIEEIIGTKIALNDKRASDISLNELIRLINNNYTAGLISSKAGVVHAHIGPNIEGLKLIFDVINKYPNINNIIPTHISRNKQILDEAIILNKKGITIDFTCEGEEVFDEIYKCFKYSLDNNSNIDKITFSSDGNGSSPEFDSNNRIIGYKIMPVDTMFKMLKFMYLNKNENLENIIPLFSTNIANILKLNRKGYIKENYDSDMIIVDKEFNLINTIINGNIFDI